MRLVPAIAFSKLVAAILMPIAALIVLWWTYSPLTRILLERLRRKQRAYRRDDGTLGARHDNRVAVFKLAVDEDDIDGSAVALDHFDLNDCALGFRVKHQLVNHHLLAELHEEQ